MSRKEIAEALKQSVARYLCPKGFSSTFELSVNNKGNRLRADVIANTIKGTIVIVETKSCFSDLTTDKKYLGYLDYCDRFYLAVTEKTFSFIKKRNYDIDPRVYVLVMSERGKLRVKKKGKKLDLGAEKRLIVLSRLAWRAGDYSKMTHSKAGKLRTVNNN